MSVVYRGFELRAGQKLLLEFTDTGTLDWDDTTGRMVYTIDELDAEFYGIGQEPDEGEDEDFDIYDEMGFCIDGNEHTYPDKVTELTADENPISITGLPTVAWEDLEVGMTVVFEYGGGIVEAKLSEEDIENAEDGGFYPFHLTASEESTTLYLKDTPEVPSISSLTSDEVGCKNAETQKEEVL